MKVKLLKQSLSPVKKDKFDAMMDEYQSTYDSILEENGQDMKVVHEKVEELIAELQNKYKNDREIEIDMPTSGKAWTKLLDEYGTIALGRHVDTDKLCLMILDSQDSGIAV